MGRGAPGLTVIATDIVFAPPHHAVSQGRILPDASPREGTPAPSSIPASGCPPGGRASPPAALVFFPSESLLDDHRVPGMGGPSRAVSGRGPAGRVASRPHRPNIA